MEFKNVLIIGGGAIGGITGAALTKQGVDVIVLDTDLDGVRRMRSGLEISCGEGVKNPIMGAREIEIPINAMLPQEFKGEADVILLCVKSQYTQKALAPVLSISESVPIVSLQNGINEEKIVELVGGERVFGCVIFWGATNLAPGRLKQTAEGGFTIGKWPKGSSQATQDIARMLNKVAPTEASNNIIGHIWNKLLINVSMTGTGTIAGYTYGEVLDDKLALRIALTVLTETYNVGKALGMKFEKIIEVYPSAIIGLIQNDYNFASEVIKGAFSENKDIRPSLLQDIEKVRKTEIDFLNGYVAKKGKEEGISVPVNEMITDLVKQIEAGKRLPSTDNLKELRDIPLVPY